MANKIILYVSPDGSDNNDGMAAGNPLLSIQAAFDALSKMSGNGLECRIILDSKIFNSPIQIRNSG